MTEALHAPTVQRTKRRRPANQTPTEYVRRLPRGGLETEAPPRSDDWPRTGRVLPWMLAVFIAVIWLTPFNQISLAVHLPFDLKLDRILLLFIAVAWCISLAAGGRNAPRMRLTPIHVAIGMFVAVAFISVLVNVGWLNNLLLLQTSLKQLLLLSSYALLFVIMASVVRPTEVRPFMKYTLVLAVLCALGSLYEFHFHNNVFYGWSHSLFPQAIFSVPDRNSSAVDELGRALTVGPAEAPLELAAMLALALPLALVGAMNARRWRGKVFYPFAACVLLAAGFSTYRKSSLVMPAVLVVTLFVLRPRQMLRLLPVAPLLLGAAHLLAPGAINHVLGQLTGSNLTTAGTTVHRTTGYDAVRPLVWSHPLVGEGYGSYDANLKRILDSQILMSAIETGVVGLIAYLAMTLSVIGTAWALFRERHGQWAVPALALGVGSLGLLTSSFLYDTMSFPHGPYIFLTFGALVAIMARAQTGSRIGSDSRIGAPGRATDTAAAHPKAFAAAE